MCIALSNCLLKPCSLVRTAALAILTLAVSLVAQHSALCMANDVPQDAEDLWSRFDPTAEPLEVEVVRQWEQDGAVMRYVRYHVGTLKGNQRTARPRMVAYYGFPKGGRKLPAILHVHGGGQQAFRDYVHYWTTLGYAAMSINWGEKPVEPGDAPNTDWDGLAAGFLDPKHHNDVTPSSDTLWSVPHPANSSWYLYVYATRRALTFLQQQPEIDPERLGLTGHSMGGRLTVLSAIDPRLKAATPSVGGSGFLYDDLWGIPGSGRKMRADLDLYNRTIDCRSSWPAIRCPVLFLGATNDFNSPTELVVKGLSRMSHNQWRFVLAPHLNHRFTDTTWAARPLWFESYLKGDFSFPKTARSELVLETSDGIPLLKVWPDSAAAHAVDKVDIYYGYDRDPRNRFWRDAEATPVEDHWEGRCPVFDLGEPLLAFANVTYRIDCQVAMPPGYSPKVNRLTVSSEYRMALPRQLVSAGVKATERPRRLIDDFNRGWHDWYQLNANNPHHWYFATRKLADPAWVGPKDGRLSFQMHTTEPDNRLGIVIDTNAWRGYAGRKRDRYVAVVPLPLRGWHDVALGAEDFRNADGRSLNDWGEITELAFTPADKALKDASISPWKGQVPRLRNLRWLGGTDIARPKPYLPVFDRQTPE